MNYLGRAKAWIVRQAVQPTSWGGTVLATVALVWQFAGTSISDALNEYQNSDPILVIFGKIGIGVVGVVCIIYNENKKNDDNDLSDNK